jgi:leucyl/phenylalanyl-tRNA---protein transferase
LFRLRATLVAQLRRWEFQLFDCQVASPYIERLGAVEWPRDRFLAAVSNALEQPTRKGRWDLDELG